MKKKKGIHIQSTLPPKKKIIIIVHIANKPESMNHFYNGKTYIHICAVRMRKITNRKNIKKHNCLVSFFLHQTHLFFFFISAHRGFFSSSNLFCEYAKKNNKIVETKTQSKETKTRALLHSIVENV